VNTGRLVRVVASNTVRSRRHFALSAFGIVVGIAAFVFFLGLSKGVSKVLLGEVFPVDQVEVIAPRASLLGKDLTKQLDDGIVDEIRRNSDVKEAVPRMAVNFPASGRGYFKRTPDDPKPQKIDFEVGGFCDGIDPSFVQGEAKSELFRYWDDEPNKKPCLPEKKCDHPFYYCDQRDNLCHHRVPVYVSPTLLELYNAQFAKSHGLPRIGKFEEWYANRGGLERMRFYIQLGDTMVVGSNLDIDKSKRRAVQGMLIGVSRKAMPVGMTIPIQYVKDWNREFIGPEAAGHYSSIVVTLKDKDDVGPFAAWLRKEPRNLRIEDSLGEQFATAISIVTWILLLISIVIVTISSINIGHSFFMQVSERQREIGVMRAIGATRADIRRIILGEAALIGVLGGTVGIFLAYGISKLVDFAASKARDFPFKPDTYFDFQWWILVGGLAFSIAFCVAGGFLPARRAARMPPAQALAQN